MSEYSIDLDELLSRENERVEWKENVADIDSVIKTIVAFSNDFSNLGGGYVVCGARESKDEYGFPSVHLVGLDSVRYQEIENRTINDLRSKVDPEIVPIVHSVSTNDPSRKVLVFVVPGTGYAHSYRSSGKDTSCYYIRVSSNTIEARNGLLRELLVRKRVMEAWDKRACTAASDTAIDIYLLRDYLSEMKMITKSTDIKSFISSTEKISEFVPPLCVQPSMGNAQYPRNFAILMFNGSPLNYVDGAYTEFSVYRGLDRSEPSAEKHSITGTIVNQARRIFELLNAEAFVVFDKTNETPNQIKYPIRALQEAVVNALVHRDYEMPQPTKITVFEDRIEILSPGRLQHTIDKEKFVNGKAHPHWRNQSLAYFFNKLQLAQAEGQGIPTILRLMKEEGCPNPIFDLEEEYVVCTLPAHPRHKLIRELNQIEQVFILGNYQEAYTKLIPLIEADSYNYRALDLLCNVGTILGKQHDMFLLFENIGLQYEKLSPNTLLSIAEAFSLGESKQHKELSLRLITMAMESRLEEKQILKAVLNLKKLRKDEDIVMYLNDTARKQPSITLNPAILEEWGRSHISLAKKCMDSGKNQKLKPAYKARAWEECRKYLELAEKNLHKALELSTSQIERDFIHRDIDYLKNLKNKAKKPASPQRRTHS